MQLIKGLNYDKIYKLPKKYKCICPIQRLKDPSKQSYYHCVFAAIYGYFQKFFSKFVSPIVLADLANAFAGEHLAEKTSFKDLNKYVNKEDLPWFKELYDYYLNQESFVLSAEMKKSHFTAVKMAFRILLLGWNGKNHDEHPE